jgi:O-antigen/teichoic acid export membrane protein
MRAINNALWLSFSRVLADVLSFLLFVAIARDFGPAGTGEYSYAFAIGALVALAAGSGLEEFGIREYVRATAAARKTVWSNLLTTQCAQLAIALSGFLLYLLLDHDRAASLAVLLELVIFQIALTIARNLFIPAMSAQAMGTPALLELSCRVGATVIALVLVLMRTPIEFPITLLSFPIAGAVLITLAYRNSVSHGATWRIDPRWSVLRDTWKRTAHFAGSETLNQFYARTDLLLIAYFLGQAHVGFYATDIKFVEVGIVPLVYFAVAVYPILVAMADGPPAQFVQAARDFCRVQLMLSGWLAVGISLLIPMLIVPMFGSDFAPAAPLLPWVSLLALVKGCEIALYRLLYSVHRQSVYFRSLAVGTVVIAVLNVLLIPRSGVVGAIHATVISTACVVLINAVGLSKRVPWRVFGELLARLAAALALTWALVVVAGSVGAAPWLRTALGCCLFPAIAAIVGLLPNLGRSTLFARPHSVPATPATP